MHPNCPRADASLHAARILFSFLWSPCMLRKRHVQPLSTNTMGKLFSKLKMFCHRWTGTPDQTESQRVRLLCCFTSECLGWDSWLGQSALSPASSLLSIAFDEAVMIEMSHSQWRSSVHSHSRDICCVNHTERLSVFIQHFDRCVFDFTGEETHATIGSSQTFRWNYLCRSSICDWKNVFIRCARHYNLFQIPL